MVNRIPVQRILPEYKTNKYLTGIWVLMQAGLLLGGTGISIDRILNTGSSQLMPFLLVCVIEIGCLILSEWLRNQHKKILSVIVRLVPWMYVLLQGGVKSLWRGANGFANLIIQGFNQAYEKGIPYFEAAAEPGDIGLFSLLLLLICGRIIWAGVWERRPYLCAGFCAFWIVISLFANAYSPVACTHLFMGMVSVEQTENEKLATKRSLVWVVSVMVVLLILGHFLPTDEMKSMERLRENVKKQIHLIRYGEETLPEGDIRQAAILKQSSDTMLSVTTQQEKNIYLRGFVGVNYEDGKWSPLSDAAYADDYAGMLDWLSSKEFDPFSQNAQYYTLCDNPDVPISNEVQVSVKKASRYYLYTPISMVDKIGGRGKQDMTLKSLGFFGTRNYQFAELSGQRPGELTVAEQWVTLPDGEEQRLYCTAESVYRDFVYDTYIRNDAGLAPLMYRIFWQDYEPDGDGIYSAVSHIRDVLKERVSYVSNPEAAPEGKDPVSFFLTESHQGNAVQYASVAVEALRAHNIPARYVEGYYISTQKAQSSRGGEIELTGHDAHAWVEAYLDGVGWITLDVTPGYYYDVMSLKRMVSLPNAVRKTAAWQSDGENAEQITDMEQDKGVRKLAQDVASVTWDALVLIFGVLAAMLILLTCMFVSLELLRMFCLWMLGRKYKNSTEVEQITMLERGIYHVLFLLGIEGGLGYRTGEIDRKLTDIYATVQQGDYTRVCALLEQTVYGDILPKPYEKRTIQTFLQKLLVGNKNMSLYTRIKIRYACIYPSNKMKK